ncbi:MAG: hypothetical protein M0R74_20655 [Dehalococcoidia bacterium]|nr:hypothetical protein [Dehalococcoidia bacterium]
MTLTGSREQSWRYEVWNSDGATGDVLDGVRDGKLAWQKNQAIKGRGHLEVVENSNGLLLDVFIRPVLTIEDWGEQAYGLWVPSFPKRDFVSATWTGTVDLVSLEALLSYTSAASILNTGNDITVHVPTSTVITTWVAAAVAAAGFLRYSVTASTKTENAPRAYMNGETLLQVINKELDRIGYSSIYSDMQGTLRAAPYVLPADRSESFSDLRPFDVDGNPIFTTAFNFTDNAPNIPNRVRAVGAPVGWLPGQTAVAVNNDPTSPYSVVNRGYVREKVYNNVNALSQTEVQTYANQQLLNLSKDGRKAEIQFPHLPGLAINQVVYFNAPRAGDPMFATVDALEVNLAQTGISSATLTAVTAVEEDEELGG